MSGERLMSTMNHGQKTTGQKTTENANPGQKTTRTKDHRTKVHQDGFSLENFPNFFEVHYKLLQRILQNFDAGGLLSGGLLSVHRQRY